MEAHYATRHRRNQTAMLAIQSTHDWKRSQRLFLAVQTPSRLVYAQYVPHLA